MSFITQLYDDVDLPGPTRTVRAYKPAKRQIPPDACRCGCPQSAHPEEELPEHTVAIGFGNLEKTHIVKAKPDMRGWCTECGMCSVYEPIEEPPKDLP